jgi:CheY-like chemotaxis protein
MVELAGSTADHYDPTMTAKPDDLVARESPVVLIVEDDPDLRRLYQTILRLAGFGTDQAHNGLQALEKAVQRLPDLILTDIAMPGIDGLELCRRLRADARTGSIPVVAVTGYPDRGYLDRATEAGADVVIVKPCPAETLIAEVRRLLARTPSDDILRPAQL